MATGFWEALEARVADANTLLVVGLDPHAADLPRREDGAPAGAAEGVAFCKRLIAATADVAAAYKPNAAFFEVWGAAGAAALEEVVAAVPAGIPVLLDGKRGDIASTAEAYAAAAYDVVHAGAVTVNAYMGLDAVAPFARPGKGVFVLCKTSNPSAGEVQALELAATGGTVYEAVAARAEGAWREACGAPLGLVVGATDVTALGRVRAAAPTSWILAPGVGFQGGDLRAALAAGLRPDGSGMLLPVSRGISRAADPAAAARALRDDINAVRAAVRAPAAVSGGGAGGSAAGASDAVAPHQREFIDAALAACALRFGSFTLKSGRVSPYFFNAGAFCTGTALAALGRTYAAAATAADLHYDVLFGPAYKGIPLATATATALAAAGRGDVPLAFNRKEAKDHGEGGTMVGADVRGKRVLIVDDVITAGTPGGQADALLPPPARIPPGGNIGLHRRQRATADSPTSAVEAVRSTYGIPVVAVVGLEHLIAYIDAAAAAGTGSLGGQDAHALLAAIRAYREAYGVPLAA